MRCAKKMGLRLQIVADGEQPVEVARLTFGAGFGPHWIAWGPKTHRVVVTSASPKDNRMYLLNFDVGRGAPTMDDGFRDVDGNVGISSDWRTWPQGWTGIGPSAWGGVFALRREGSTRTGSVLIR